MISQVFPSQDPEKKMRQLNRLTVHMNRRSQMPGPQSWENPGTLRNRRAPTIIQMDNNANASAPEY